MAEHRLIAVNGNKPPGRRLSRTQLGVALGMASGFCLSAIIIVVGAHWQPFGSGAVPNFATRLQFALGASILVFVWLVAAIGDVARARFFSADDIEGSGLSRASAGMSVRLAILENTFEQAVLAAGAYLGLAAVSAQALVWIPPLVLLFWIGRAAFWIGYRHGAVGRAFGFATTFYPSVFAYIVAIIAIADQWA
ncbi:MAG: MAPEG family protein [Stellaceae bacterium]